MPSRTSEVHPDQSQQTDGTSRLQGEPEEPAHQPISRRKVLLRVGGLATVAVAGSSIVLLTHTSSSTKPPVASPTPTSTSSGAMRGNDPKIRTGRRGGCNLTSDGCFSYINTLHPSFSLIVSSEQSQEMSCCICSLHASPSSAQTP